MTNKIKDTLLMVSNYNADISWILEYTDNYIIYDRSDTDEWTKIFDQSKVKRVSNIGWDIYDKFTYIIDNYDNLPDTMILTKGNVFKYITREEFDEICNNKSFTPIFTKYHPVQLPIAFYSKDGMYNEINNSWYLGVHPAKYIKTYNDFVWKYLKKLPKYIKFAPGSNYLVTKNDVLKYPKSFYGLLRKYIDYGAHPGEAQVLERILYLLWKGELNLDLPWYFKSINYVLTKIQNITLSIKKKSPIIIKKIIIRFKHELSNAKKQLLNIYNKYKIIITWKSPLKIIEYRKKIKVYDIFTFFNEFDLLEIRLNILDSHVDYFVIVEATETFSGLPKPLYYETNKARFKKWEHKIIHYVIDDTPKDENELRQRLNSKDISSLDREIIVNNLTSSNVPKGEIHWLKEFYQKENIKKALVKLKDSDICFVGDVDEIWNPEILIDYSQNDIFKLRQNVHPYYVNNRSNEKWAGTLITKYKNIKENCLNHLRTESKTNYTYLKNGGWHFTNQGGADTIKTKLESYGHQEFNNDDIKSQIDKRLKENKDFIGRGFKFWVDESDLPKYILENKLKYKHLFK